MEGWYTGLQMILAKPVKHTTSGFEAVYATRYGVLMKLVAYIKAKWRRKLVREKDTNSRPWELTSRTGHILEVLYSLLLSLSRYAVGSMLSSTECE